MYIFDTPLAGKVGWILPPKTGTRSVEKAIRKTFDVASTGGRHGVPRGEIKNCDLLVANIRHPFDVLRSWYDYHPSGRKSNFDQWLRDQVTGNGQRRINYLELSTLPGADFASEFMRYEDGPADEVERIFRLFGVDPPQLEHIGRARNPRPWRQVFSRELEAIAFEKYQDDFHNFNYTR